MNVSAVQIPPDSRAAHRGLSPAAERFLEYLLENPDEAARLEGMEDVLPKWTFTYDFTPLTWPVFVGAAKLAELRRATEGVCGLIKAIPAVVFDGDVEAIAAFYGYEHPEYVEMLFEVPNALDSTFARCDFIDTPAGLQCCEVNMAANIGGWQHRFWEETYLRHPVVTTFAAREGFAPRWRDPLHAAVAQVVEDAVATGVADGNEVNVLVPFAEPLGEWARGFARELYAALLRRATGPGFGGELWVSADPAGELEWRDNVPYFEGRRVHVYVEYGLDTPPAVLRAQIAGTLRVYNGGLTTFMVDKRNLALLSENEDLEYWTDEDRALIRAHIPWTRLVQPRTTTYRGETVTFPAFLLERREDLVLKLGAGFGGADVHVGRHTDPAAWETAVREAVEHGGWIVQEYVESKPYLYPPKAGAAPVPHSVIWGLFCTGWRYAGAWLRMLPRGTGDGIVNSGRGAAEGAVLEVEEKS